jgi:hypothetical protein
MQRFFQLASGLALLKINYESLAATSKSSQVNLTQFLL